MANGPETRPEIETRPELPAINWREAAEGARLGDYEPAYWVTDFKEIPELTNIPEPAKPGDVLLVHWRDRMKYETRLEVLMKLPQKGEIAASLITRQNAMGGPIGIILEPAKGAITEMHVTDVNSAPGHEGMPEGARKAANPSDRRILRQLHKMGRLTPEQVAVIQIEEGNEVFVESSKVKVFGIIYNSAALEINSELLWKAKGLKIPVYEIREEKIIRKI